MNVSKFKTIDLAIVIAVAEELMSNFQGTTTKEVKEELRKKGYWAIQHEVSNLMMVAGDQQDWNVDASADYRKYTLKDKTTVPASINGVAINVDYTNRKGINVQSTNTPKTGDRKYFTTVNGVTQVAYFTRDTEPSLARNAMAVTAATKQNQVYSKIVK
jgi:hypothetical protein